MAMMELDVIERTEEPTTLTFAPAPPLPSVLLEQALERGWTLMRGNYGHPNGQYGCVLGAIRSQLHHTGQWKTIPDTPTRREIMANVPALQSMVMLECDCHAPREIRLGHALEHHFEQHRMSGEHCIAFLRQHES